MEASLLSVNRNRYGDLHNFGHLMLAYIHDPDNRYQVNLIIIPEFTHKHSLTLISWVLKIGNLWNHGGSNHSDERSGVLRVARVHG